MGWAQPKQTRDQLVLFAEKLDEAVPQDHSVRILWGILQRIDWSCWEDKYVLTKGQPPIHPSILAGVVLYGILKRIRTTRGLEEALKVRMDFRWLAEGRSIDHTTLAKFRQSNGDALRDLFVQVGMVAQQMGELPLVTLGYDGTRLRASNRRNGSRTPAELREARAALAQEFAAHAEAAERAQSGEDQAFDAAAAADHDRRGKQLQRQAEQIEAALAELERIESEGKKIPARLPITDPHSRVAPNKEGGYAPNYNPTVTVDIDSGLIVDADVIRGIDEQSHMLAAVERVRETFLADDPAGADRPIELLADGLMATGENIVGCEENNIEYFSPAGPANPAYRDDPTQPVAAELLDQLPLRGKKPKPGEEDKRTFDKTAFVYDLEADLFFCPMGKKLERRSQTKDHRGDERFIYRAAKSDCVGCPLKARCFKDARDRTGRRIECGKHEPAKQTHTAKMQSEESRAKYARRSAPTERPFAIIKRVFGARAFHTRGIENVRQEWRWLVVGFNLHRLLGLLAAQPQPP